ncbi:hypothetical protein C0J52_02046 [Blattella germanica]|nr:hypothetical protein C0J52_02046 [Blattella germanica]
MLKSSEMLWVEFVHVQQLQEVKQVRLISCVGQFGGKLEDKSSQVVETTVLTSLYLWRAVLVRMMFRGQPTLYCNITQSNERGDEKEKGKRIDFCKAMLMEDISIVPTSISSISIVFFEMSRLLFMFTSGDAPNVTLPKDNFGITAFLSNLNLFEFSFPINLHWILYIPHKMPKLGSNQLNNPLNFFKILNKLYYFQNISHFIYIIVSKSTLHIQSLENWRL